MNEEQAKQVMETLIQIAIAVANIQTSLANVQAQLHELDQKVDLID